MFHILRASVTHISCQCPLIVVVSAVVLDLLRRIVIGVILILTTVVLIVHTGGILLGTMMGALAVVFVHTCCRRSANVSLPGVWKPEPTFCLGKLVDFATNEACEELFGELMVHLFAYKLVIRILGFLGSLAEGGRDRNLTFLALVVLI